MSFTLRSSRFEEFGLPLVGLATSERFRLHRVNWEGTDIDPTDTAEVSYTDKLRHDLPMRTSIRTYHDGRLVQTRATADTSLHQHLFTSFSPSFAPSGTGLKNVWEEFSQEVTGISLRDGRLVIDGGHVECRWGVFRFMSVAEIVIENRVATLVGPDGFLEERFTVRITH